MNLEVLFVGFYTETLRNFTEIISWSPKNWDFIGYDFDFSPPAQYVELKIRMVHRKDSEDINKSEVFRLIKDIEVYTGLKNKGIFFTK